MTCIQFCVGKVVVRLLDEVRSIAMKIKALRNRCNRTFIRAPLGDLHGI
jgi:hypothetical protein